MNWFKKLRERHIERLRKMLDRRVNNMFQIKERDGMVWIVYEGCFICPCYMLKEDPIVALKIMREEYKKHLDSMR